MYPITKTEEEEEKNNFDLRLSSGIFLTQTKSEKKIIETKQFTKRFNEIRKIQ